LIWRGIHQQFHTVIAWLVLKKHEYAESTPIQRSPQAGFGEAKDSREKHSIPFRGLQNQK
jgi:hypothetical protein